MLLFQKHLPVKKVKTPKRDPQNIDKEIYNLKHC